MSFKGKIKTSATSYLSRLVTIQIINYEEKNSMTES